MYDAHKQSVFAHILRTPLPVCHLLRCVWMFLCMMLFSVWRWVGVATEPMEWDQVLAEHL